jgi:dihydrofolate reductase
MRKLISGSFLALDGVIENPWEWIGPFFPAENKAHASAKIDETEFFLLGRKTFERFSSTWPNIKGDEYMDKINALSKLVVSDRLANPGWNSKVLKTTDFVAKLKSLKEEGGKHILKYGLGQLDDVLLQHGLLDELELSIIPITVGKGKRAFEDFKAKNFNLVLKGTKTFKNGVVALTYVPENKL